MKTLTLTILALAISSVAFASFDTTTGIVDSTTTFTGSETISTPLTVSQGAVFTIGDGTNKSSLSVNYAGQPMKNSGLIEVKANSELIVTNTNAPTWAGAGKSGALDIYGAAVLNTSEQNAYFYLSGNVNVYSGGFLKSNSILWLEDNLTLDLQNGSKADFSELYIASSTLKIAENVKFGGSYTSKIVATSGNYVTIDASEAQTVNLKGLCFAAANSLTIKLSSELFSVSEIEKTKGDPTDFILNDFKNNIFKVENRTNLEISGEQIIITKSDSSQLKLNLYAENNNGEIINLTDDQYWYFSDEGFLNIANYDTVVPEPAEWAIILGSIALGLAVYRRRK